MREGARRAACKNHLRQIGIASHLYADDYDGIFPRTFLELSQGQYADNPCVFSCPSEPSKYKDFLPGGQVTEDSSSFTCVAGLSSSMPGQFVIAYDKEPGNHKKEGKEGGRHVLHIDSSVDWWPASRESEFQRRLALQNEAVAKWRTSGKPVEAFKEFISPELLDLMAK